MSYVDHGVRKTFFVALKLERNVTRGSTTWTGGFSAIPAELSRTSAIRRRMMACPSAKQRRQAAVPQ